MWMHGGSEYVVDEHLAALRAEAAQARLVADLRSRAPRRALRRGFSLAPQGLGCLGRSGPGSYLNVDAVPAGH